MRDPVPLGAVPVPLGWELAPIDWEYGDGTLRVAAGPRTDLFADPRADSAVVNAPRLLGPVEGDFVFSARVRVGFAATYDAGALLAWVDDRCWGKLCLEYSPQAEPMIVSVVTRDRSDDANAFVTVDRAWLRIARLGSAYAFHASTDGMVWQFVRYFALPDGAAARIGFAAQSPTGDGCTVWFDEITYRAERLADLRDGS